MSPSSKQAAASEPPKCSACYDDLSPDNTVEAPCKHTYCFDCIKVMVKQSLVSGVDVQFPPKCCDERLTLSTIGAALREDLQHQYQQKLTEQEQDKKVYCSTKDCETFITSNYFWNNKFATCKNCRGRTCITCKNEWHKGKECPADTALNKVLDIAQKEGWKRCPGCKALVERVVGCHLIKVGVVMENIL